VQPNPFVSLRPKPRALLVVGAAALAGIVLAFALVPGGGGGQRPRAEVSRAEPAAAPRAEPVRPAAAPAVRDERVEPIAVPAQAPAPVRERVAVAPAPREKPRARERERERPRKLRTTPVENDLLYDARAPEPAAPPDAGIVDKDLVDPVFEPAPAPVAAKPAPPVPAPKPRPVKAPEPEPEAEPRGSLDAVPSIGGIDVKGPLQDSEIRRGASRVLSAFRSCYKTAARSAGKTPKASVKLTFEIDESRAAKSISAGSSSLPGLTSCIVSAAGKIRTRIAPDVGTAQVTIRVEFDPTK
jgi:hypothetical protein